MHHKKVLLLFLNKFMHALIMATLKRRFSHPIDLWSWDAAATANERERGGLILISFLRFISGQQQQSMMKPCFFVKSSLGQPKIPTLIPAITNQTNVWMGRGCFRFKSGCVGRFQKPRYWAFSPIGLSKSSLGCFLSLSLRPHSFSTQQPDGN